jgi:hypothetical protein
MMKSILVSALLATIPATLYAAPPERVAQREVQTYDRDRGTWNREHYDRWNNSRWAHDYHGRWRMIGSYNNARQDRQSISVAGQRLHKLRIEAVRGEPRIERVTLMFLDGSSQTIDVSTRLEQGSGEVIDLDSDRRIRRVIVEAAPRTRGVYAVYAS